MGKQNLYDHSLRVPLIIAGPGIGARERINELVCHFDLFPTLCELTGHEAPGAPDGRSLLPAMQGQPGREELYLAYGSSIRGLLQGHWKLVEYAAPEYRSTQLFNLETDPNETFDQSNNLDQVQRIQQMRKRLQALGEATGDLQRQDGKSFWLNYQRG
jgi:arylsulfatase A-like enzyme